MGKTCRKISITIMIAFEKRSQINQTLVFIFQSNLDFKKFIAIMIAIENLIRINRTLI